MPKTSTKQSYLQRGSGVRVDGTGVVVSYIVLDYVGVVPSQGVDVGGDEGGGAFVHVHRVPPPK